MCTHPIEVRGMVLPCGKCTFCKIAKTKEWSVRLLCEAIYWDKKSMLTLTYDDEHLPSGNTLVKSDLQDFFKRLRARIYPDKIKYFACGEYGDQFGRPHYHIAILGVEDEKLVSSCWPYGFVKVRPFHWNTVKYVCRYVFKKYGVSWNKKIYGDLEPPFQLQSNGIGLSFIKEYKDILKENLSIPVYGEKINLPRYYVDKLGITSRQLVDYNLKKNLKSAAKFQKRLDVRLSKVIDNINDLNDLNSFNIEKYAAELQNEINNQREMNQKHYLAIKQKR